MDPGGPPLLLTRTLAELGLLVSRKRLVFAVLRLLLTPEPLAFPPLALRKSSWVPAVTMERLQRLRSLPLTGTLPAGSCSLHP